MMRVMIAAAALAALSSSALAQQGRPAPRPAAPAPAPAQEPPPPPIFLCRTQAEVCTLGIPTGANQIAVLFTNAPNAQASERPIDVLTGEAGTPLDLAPHLGRVVMLTGTFDPKGLTMAELVEVASPLLSTLIKAQLLGGDEPSSPPAKQAPGAKKR